MGAGQVSMTLHYVGVKQGCIDTPYRVAQGRLLWNGPAHPHLIMT